MPVIPSLGRLKKEGYCGSQISLRYLSEFKARLHYIERSCLRETTTTTNPATTIKKSKMVQIKQERQDICGVYFKVRSYLYLKAITIAITFLSVGRPWQ